MPSSSGRCSTAPACFATYLGVAEPAAAVLGRLTARVEDPVRAGTEHVVIARPLDVDGRKRRTGSAVLSDQAEVLALGNAVMIERRAAARATLAGASRVVSRLVPAGEA